MSAVKLSTGQMLLSDDVQMAAYYPRGSVRSDGLVNLLVSGDDAAVTKHERDLLYVRTIHTGLRVLGKNAALDANALEEAGIPVYRSPN